jgi:hypothetical protein
MSSEISQRYLYPIYNQKAVILIMKSILDFFVVYNARNIKIDLYSKNCCASHYKMK